MENGSRQLQIEKTWQCRSCIQQFESKGKRDAHHRKEHQKLVTINVSHEKQSIEKSTKGDFICSCGKVFLHVQSLQRHSKGCIDRILMDEDDFESIQYEERNASIPDVIALRQLEEQ